MDGLYLLIRAAKLFDSLAVSKCVHPKTTPDVDQILIEWLIRKILQFILELCDALIKRWEFLLSSIIENSLPFFLVLADSVLQPLNTELPRYSLHLSLLF